MTIGIYKITNTINNKCYVGQSIDIERRIKEHINNGKKMKYNLPIYKALQKYGEDNFTFDILFCCFSSDFGFMDEMERYFIDLYQPEYNLTTGGTFGYTYTDDVKKKLSILNKRQRKPFSDQAKRSIGESLTRSYVVYMWNGDIITFIKTDQRYICDMINIAPSTFWLFLKGKSLYKGIIFIQKFVYTNPHVN